MARNLTFKLVNTIKNPRPNDTRFPDGCEMTAEYEVWESGAKIIGGKDKDNLDVPLVVSIAGINYRNGKIPTDDEIKTWLAERADAELKRIEGTATPKNPKAEYVVDIEAKKMNP